MTPEQFERLPKFARDHIEQLTRERDEAQKDAKAAAMQASDGDAVTFYPRGFTRGGIGGGDNAFCVFRIENEDVRISTRDDELQVQTAGRTARPLAVVPSSSNSIRIRMTDY